MPQRPYISSHPWISFGADLSRVDSRTWILLGESTSKCEHISRALIRPEDARELLQVYLVRGAVATTAIEGNTLSEEEARLLVDQGRRLPASKEYLGKEIENIVEALNEIKVAMIDDGSHEDLTVAKVKEYNRQVLRGLELEAGAIPGEIRRHSVTVGAYRGAPWQDCAFLLERLCDWLGSDEFSPPDTETQRPLSVIKAVIAHLYVAWIHPFGDGNGRTARLIETHLLLAAGFPMPTAQLLSNHYNETRSEYYRQLELASKRSDPIPFIQYAIEGFVDQLRMQLDRVWGMQYLDRWEQFIYESFGEVTTESSRRRRRLVKDLSKVSLDLTNAGVAPTTVPREQIRRLSPELAEMFATKTDRTLSRDINALLDMGLITRQPGGYLPNSDVILGLQAPRRSS